MGYLREYNKALISYNINAISRRILNKELIEQKYRNPVIDAKSGNNYLKQIIKSNTPFAVARLGGTEIRTIADCLYTEKGYPLFGIRKRTLDRICKLSGFFPATKENIIKFSNLYLEMLPEIDVLCVWNCFMQSYFANNYSHKAILTTLYALEPYYFEEPWSYALKGKKVLVIHPFAESIEKQFARRNHLFENTNVLPDMELMTLKAVQSLGGTSEFQTWFDALNWMYQEAMKKNFDVALIGCGAYGLPLAIKFKQAGKQAIQIGGALQLLFGIKGKRWETKPEAKSLFNDYWIRPSEKERPQTANSVEGACYW